tara:strand:- start:115 stop:306 length:192 start_codon:yes stop_codon:yes gene_type:complete
MIDRSRSYNEALPNTSAFQVCPIAHSFQPEQPVALAEAIEAAYVAKRNYAGSRKRPCSAGLEP